jgi:ABC-2 type transport system ATP-binding protein
MAPFANGRVMRLLGYCPEIDNFYEEMTGREFVTLLGAMAGLKGATLKARVDESIARVGMTDRCDRKVRGLLQGDAAAHQGGAGHRPRSAGDCLDEPLNGLDPVGRREMSQLMMEFARQGRCVLVSSHILYEVEQITDNILLIERGRIVAQGNLRGIRDLMDRHPHHITLTLLAEPARVRALARDLLALPSVLGVRFDPQRADRLTVETSQPDVFYSCPARRDPGRRLSRLPISTHPTTAWKPCSTIW